MVQPAVIFFFYFYASVFPSSSFFSACFSILDTVAAVNISDYIQISCLHTTYTYYV